MELPWQQICLLLLVAFLISTVNPAAPPVRPKEPVNKQENPPLVQHKYHPSTSPTSTIKTEPASPEMLTKRDTHRVTTTTAIFPVAGNVYPDKPYYASIYIGEPPKLYFLEIDTGSELTWLRCNAPRHSPAAGPHSLYILDETKLVSPEDPLCVFQNNPLSSESVSVKKRCQYKIDYFDAGSSRGVLVKDTFNISLTDGSVIRTNLAFGCGYDQKGSLAISPSAADGVLGLINSKLSVVSQLKDQGLLRNVIGHCFNGQGGGYLFFGDDQIPSSGMTWIPMSHNPSDKYYSSGPANLILGNQLVMKDVVVVFDSGTTYTYLASQPYQAFITMVKKNILEKPLSETSDGAFPLCWKGTKPFKTILDVKDYFNPLILEFKNSKNGKLQISPEGYLIITSQGYVCLGVLSGDEEGLELNLLGDISLQHHLVVYDNEKNKIGWFPSDCKRLPNMDGDDGYQEGYTRPYSDNMGILKEEPLECPPEALPQQSDVERCEALVSEQSKRCTSSEISSHDGWINKCGIL